MSFDRLIAKIEKTQNPTVLGLDPSLTTYQDISKRKLSKRMAKRWRERRTRSFALTRP